jgi:hypothetical protein
MPRIILAPEWATAGLFKFGVNRYGQPNFRVVWSPSRTRIIGGFWQDNGRHEYRRVPKYGTQPRWVLERFRPASMYGTPRQWDLDTITADGFYAVGPFPSHGEYECCEVFQAKGHDGKPIKGWAGFVPLEAGLIELTARAVWMGRINSYSDIRITLRDEELAKERRQDQRMDEIWADRQHQHKGGLTIGAHGSYNHQAEIDEYVRKLEKIGGIHRGSFREGFNQN